MAMMKMTDTIIASHISTGWKTQTKAITMFLANNHNKILLDPSENNSLIGRANTSTPVDKMIHRITELSLLEKIFRFVYIPNNLKLNVPAVLADHGFVLDLKELVVESEGLSVTSEFKDKIVVDITPWATKNRGGGIEINNETLFKSFLTKAIISRSFNSASSNKQWLSPSLRSFIAKSYCMVIGEKIKRLASLDLETLNKVKFILAVYMLQKSEMTTTIPPVGLVQLNNLFGGATATGYLTEEIFGIQDRPITFTKCIELISVLIKERTPNFSEFAVISSCKSLGGDTVTGSVGLEYPPYWAYMILAAISQSIPSLLEYLKTLGVVKNRLSREAVDFSNELTRIVATQLINSTP